ncbi:hypothetical protein [Pseudomonas nitroreducens]|uniref:hypothetical protein n=1 Tax=Pseudomonas nitroreducens TaxID=46680 RepID=UPI00265A5D3A|nr:hypothetical protein [Pseudomonas nitroreducens]MCP1652724.1 hypothetical protein [Pseudomonas nitroreducens]
MTEALQNALIRLGDMMGDGMHLEPGGAWIEREYRATVKALGLGAPRRNNREAIDKAVGQYVADNRCACGGVLVQTRAGSLRVACKACAQGYQLKRQKRPPAND